MAFVECPECQNKISDEARYCSNCGCALQETIPEEVIEETPKEVPEEVIEEAPKVEAPVQEPLLFSTKGRYKSKYTGFVVVYILAYVAGFIALGSLSFGIGGAIWILVFYLLTAKTLRKQKGMYWSYVNLYPDKICGVTSSTDDVYEKGSTFAVTYKDVNHVDNIANDVLVLHTTYGKYSVQTCNCANEVIAIIKKQKESLK